MGKVNRLEMENKLMRDRLKEVEAMAREAKKKGDTAMNKANEARRIAGKK